MCPKSPPPKRIPHPPCTEHPQNAPWPQFSRSISVKCGSIRTSTARISARIALLMSSENASLAGSMLTCGREDSGGRRCRRGTLQSDVLKGVRASFQSSGTTFEVVRGRSQRL